MRKPRAVILAITVAPVALLAWPAMAQAETVELVSVDTAIPPAGANEVSQDSAISADGRYVAFESEATNLATGDSNAYWDIYVRDRQLGTTELASVSINGGAGNGASENPSISADGRYVAFESVATDLVLGDSVPNRDIFVRDLVEKLTIRMSAAAGGAETNGASSSPSVAADDEQVYVAYQSTATNLATPDGNGSRSSVFVSYYSQADPNPTDPIVTTQLVSTKTGGTQTSGLLAGASEDPSISADGRYVAYESTAALASGDIALVDKDIYVTDWNKDDDPTNNVTKLASVATGGSQVWLSCENPSISADGQYVAYESLALNLVSPADPLWPNYRDIFVTDWNKGSLADVTTQKASVSSAGTSGNGASQNASLSGDGRYVAFQSAATNLVPGDTLGYTDIFVRYVDWVNPANGTTHLISTDFYGNEASGSSGGASITPSLSGVVPQVSFYSSAYNLVPWDGNEGLQDVFVATTDTTPTITSLNPTSGSTEGSTSVYVIGTNFVGLSGASAVAFGGFNALGYTPISTMKLLATAPAHTAGMVQVQVTAAGGKTQDTPADDYTYLAALVKKLIGHHRYEQTDLHLLYSGQWDTGSNNSHSAGSIYYSDDEEGTITITFKGTKLDWIAEMGPLMGKALVSIDGGEPVLVDLFSQTELLQQMVWSTGDLSYGVHVIKISFPEGSGSSENKTINIDALDVWGTLLETTQS